MSKEEMIAAITAKDPFRVVAFEDEDGLRKLYNEVVGDLPDSPADLASLTPNTSDDKTKITIYHGSEFVIKEPEFGGGFEHNDYGRGFYATKNKGLAGEWAVLNTGRDGYINEYILNRSELHTLKLDKLDIKCWIAVLMKYKKGRFEQVAIERRDRFIETFGIDISSYDIIEGWRADDSFFSYIDEFLNMGLSVESLQQAMLFGDLGLQVCLKSPKAFSAECLRMTKTFPASADEYYAKAKKRDLDARRKFFNMRNRTRGTLIFDLIGRD